MRPTTLRLPEINVTMFFDTDKVRRLAGDAAVKSLSKGGAYIRRRARSSIRKRKRISRPGQPPSSHTGVLRGDTEGGHTGIIFSYDPQSDSVVIGPVRTNQLFVEAGGFVSGTVPSVLEFGGSVGIFEVQRRGEWHRADLRSRRRLAGKPTRVRVVRIAARPYMGPALAAELPRLPELFANSIGSQGVTIGPEAAAG